MNCLSRLALCACAVAATATSNAAFVDVTSPGDDIAGTQLVLSDGSLDLYTNHPPSEGPEKAIDDSVDSKYLSFQGSGFNDDGEQVQNPTGLVVVLDTPAAIGGVKFGTGNDWATRDPAAVKIYGTNMGGSAATIADTATAADLTLVYDGSSGIPTYSEVGDTSVTEGRQIYTPTRLFPESDEFAAYVVIVTDLVRYPPNSPTTMQFSEIQLLQVPEPSTIALMGLSVFSMVSLARRRSK